MTDTMTEQDRTARLRLPLLGLASVALFHLTVILPPVGLIAAAPLYYLFAAYPATAGLVTLMGGGVVTLAVSGPMAAFLYLVVAGGIGWYLAEGFRTGRPVAASVLRSAGIPWGMLALALFGLAQAAGETVRGLLTKGSDGAIALLIEQYQTTGADDARLALLVEQREELVSFLAAFFPAISFVILFAASVATMMVVRLVSVRASLNIHFAAPFAAFRAPDELVWGVVVGGFGGYLVEGPVGELAFNALIIAFAVYVLQGLALLHHSFTKWNTPTLLRAFCYFLIFSEPILWGLAGCFGVADVWIDFRNDTRRGGDDASLPRD